MQQRGMEKRRGLLIVNLGTPKSFRPKDVFRYLIEFLTDRRVIEGPWWKRQLLVRAVIVPFRYRQSAELYRRLWTPNGFPLLLHGQAVQEKLQEALGAEYRVALAMRYQSPSIKEELDKLRQEGIDELIVLPLFPQYASATTGSIHQKVMESLQSWVIFPKLIFINHYFDHPKLIEAFCARAKPYSLSFYDHILFSFHGLPESQIRLADSAGICLSHECCQQTSFQSRHCYKAQCYATARAIADHLHLNEKNYSICFQSRLGKEPWMQPYTADVIHTCAQKGHKRLLVFCPSFICDCLETTCEITHEYGQEFKKAGGEELQLVEGLNSHPEWIEALRSIVLEHQS
jgi:protoporphyrin/coproporphyrin ferrochelatase